MGMRLSVLIIAILLVSPAPTIAQDGVAIFSIGDPSSGLTGSAALAGPVSDAEKALAVARPVLISIYGKKQIQSEEPLVASLAEGIWSIEGSMHCHPYWWQKLLRITPYCVGGTAELKLSAKTGAILKVTHYK
jgi:hypothetical protein